MFKIDEEIKACKQLLDEEITDADSNSGCMIY